MSFLDYFKPAPHIEALQDPKEIRKKYRYWRLRTFYSMYIGYAAYYLTRKSYTFAIPAIKEHLGFDTCDIGMLGTVFSLAYGISKFTSGMVADRSNPRFFMATGLILTGICNILFGSTTSFTAFAVYWGLNGWFQGFGWPGCARLLTHWYSQNERGTWWGLWNTSHNVGGFLIPYIAAYFAALWGWQYAVYVPGVIGIVLGFFLLNRLRDTPQSLGLPSIERFRNDYPDNHKGGEEELSFRDRLFKYVLNNPLIWLLGVAYFFVYVVRVSINDWTMLYFKEFKGYEMVVAGAAVSTFEIGGFFGSLVSGPLSDRIFKGRRGPVNLIFMLGVLVTTIVFWYFPGGGPFLDSIFIFLMGFFIFGPQMLIGVAAAELSHKKAAATATGFVGCFAYFGGASFAGGPMGYIIDQYGWDTYHIVLIACALLAALVLIPTWKVRSNPKFAK